jgi:predicted GNAT family N-acyltransferase
MNHTIDFKIISYDSSIYKQAIALREAILRAPLGLSFAPEDLVKEKDHTHIVGLLNDEVVATCMLVAQGKKCKMQRVAVKNGLQGMRVGTQMLAFFEDFAKQSGFNEIYCHARKTAVPFYLKNGYVTEGEEFIETTIPHIRMLKKISY